MTYQQLIHDFGITTWQDWGHIDISQLLRDAKQNNNVPMMDVLQKMLEAKANPNAYMIQNISGIKKARKSMVAGIGEWVLGHHIDDYFATIPQDCINIIADMLTTIVIRTCSLVGKNYHIIRYFCGQQHDLHPLQPSGVYIDHDFFRSVNLTWKRFGKTYQAHPLLPTEFYDDGIGIYKFYWTNHENMTCFCRGRPSRDFYVKNGCMYDHFDDFRVAEIAADRIADRLLKEARKKIANLGNEPFDDFMDISTDTDTDSYDDNYSDLESEKLTPIQETEHKLRMILIKRIMMKYDQILPIR